VVQCDHITSKQDSSLLILFIHPCSNILYSLKIILQKALLLFSEDALFCSPCLTGERSSEWMFSQPAFISKLMLLIKWLTEMCVFLPVWFRMHQTASSHHIKSMIRPLHMCAHSYTNTLHLPLLLCHTSTLYPCTKPHSQPFLLHVINPKAVRPHSPVPKTKEKALCLRAFKSQCLHVQRKYKEPHMLPSEQKETHMLPPEQKALKLRIWQENSHYSKNYLNIHSPATLFGTPVQLLINT